MISLIESSQRGLNQNTGCDGLAVCFDQGDVGGDLAGFQGSGKDEALGSVKSSIHIHEIQDLCRILDPRDKMIIILPLARLLVIASIRYAG